MIYRRIKYAYLPTKTEDCGWIWLRCYQQRRIVTGVISTPLNIIQFQEYNFALDFKEFDEVDLFQLEVPK